MAKKSAKVVEVVEVAEVVVDKAHLLSLSVEQLVEMIINLREGRKGRKGEILDFIKKGGITIEGLAGMAGITCKNVSSILSGLRNDGFVFITYKVGKENFLDYVGKRDGEKIFNDDGQEVSARGVIV